MDDYQLEILLNDLESDKVERKASNPRQFIPGAYIQFLCIDGTEITDPIKDQKEIDGPLSEQLRLLDECWRLIYQRQRTSQTRREKFSTPIIQ